LKKLIIKLFIPVLAVLIMFSGTLAVSASWDPYPYGTCTWYAWRAARDIAGVTLPVFGNAEEWYANAASDGYSVGTVPKADSIAVFRDLGYATTGYGHVAYVKSVDGSLLNVTEGSYRGMFSHDGTVPANAIRWAGTGHEQKIIGYVYLKEKVITVPQVNEVSSLSLLNNEIKLTWKNVKEIFRWDPDSQTFAKIKKTAGTSFNDTKLEKGETYVYKVRAYTIANGIQINGSASDKLTGAAMDATPASLKAQDDLAAVTAPIWNIISDVVGYIS
jgi:surface antigen